jgi:hypothetical protein
MKNNILVSSICFVNRNKPGAEIYATFTRRLINDVMVKSPYDVRIITNEPEHFKEDIEKWGERVIIKHDDLANNQLTVGPFNQNLKYKTLENISEKYNWVLYLDCDAGFTDILNANDVDRFIEYWESEGYDMLATRTNCTVRGELEQYKKWEHEHLNEIANGNASHWYQGGLFTRKFKFYNVTLENGPVEWLDAVLPSEHVFLVKNNNKLPIMAKEFEKFNQIFEKQVNQPYIETWDMEAFEIGVSAKLAGYIIGDFNNDGLYHIIKVVCNHNNWEKVKY